MQLIQDGGAGMFINYRNSTNLSGTNKTSPIGVCGINLQGGYGSAFGVPSNNSPSLFLN